MATKKTTTKEQPTKPAKKPAAEQPAMVEKAAAETAAETKEEVLASEDLAVEEIAEVGSSSDQPTGKEAKLKQGRRKLVKNAQKSEHDTGSTDVQIALLTGKINDLVKHLKEHAKDNDSRQGLLKMVGRRRRLLRFLKKSQPDRYVSLISELKLRK